MGDLTDMEEEAGQDAGFGIQLTLNGSRSTPGYVIQSQRMVYIVLHAICFAKFV